MSESKSDAIDKERAGNTFRLPARVCCNNILSHFLALDGVGLAVAEDEELSVFQISSLHGAYLRPPWDACLHRGEMERTSFFILTDKTDRKTVAAKPAALRIEAERNEAQGVRAARAVRRSRPV